MNILVATEDKETSEFLRNTLESVGYEVTLSHDGTEAFKLLNSLKYDVLIGDVDLPGMDAMSISQVFTGMQKNNPSGIILFSEHDNAVTSLAAMDSGVRDILIKPIDVNRLLLLLTEIWNGMSGQGEITLDDWRTFLMTGSEQIQVKRLPLPINRTTWLHNNTMGVFSEKMIQIYTKLRKLEEYPDIPVLLEGETGTGKEVMARNIHLLSSSEKESPFIALNCSLFSSELFNAELFGYEKGSFTGADQRGREGKISLAKGGTLFLDEISETTPEVQAKLLRLLQQGEYFSVGGLTLKKIECRVICSTNRPVQDRVAKNLFRSDLYYRLSTCHIKIPSLHERKEEILPLAVFFMKKLISEFDLKNVTIEREALIIMETYTWPGNIRELENFIKQNLLFNAQPIISLQNIKDYIDRNQRDHNVTVVDPNHFNLPEFSFDLQKFNIDIIKKALDKFEGNKTKVAEYLGLTRSQLYNRFKI